MCVNGAIFFARTMQPDSLFEWGPVCGWKHPEMCLSIWVPGVALSVWWVKTGKHFKRKLKNLTELYFTTNDKQVLQLIWVSLIGTDVSMRGSLLWEEARVPGKNPRIQAGDSHTLSKSGDNGEKRVHCPLIINLKIENDLQ